MTDPRDRAILAERAQRLAERAKQENVRRAVVRAVILRAGSESYGMDLQALRQVVEATPISPLPGLPPHILGIAAARGEIVSVVDVAELHGLGRTGTVELFAVIERGDRCLALGVEEVLGFRDIYQDELVDPLRDHAEGTAFSRWFTRDRVRLLDADALLNSPRLVVRGSGPRGGSDP